jgi:predicted metalloprotease with PDZ domain
VSDYATARVRIAMPEGWGCVVSGRAVDTADTSLRDLLGPIGNRRSSTFIAAEPVRYLSLVASHFVRVVDAMGVTSAAASNRDGSDAPPSNTGRSLTLRVDANPRQVARGREVATTASDVLQFYAQLMNDLPYPSMTIAVVEDELPGGHSPAYATVLNSPPPASQLLWRNDPAAFQGFPEFFLAHELAHQWWGQAIGWKNYHEQWISEGFAQYFAALYAQRSRGDGVFQDMLRQFRRWAIAESDEGPVYLGYRLGHVKSDTRVFRALVYNKGASVLHMLRRLVGDQAFFNGLRRFYSEQRFRKAGTDDFARAMEAESGMPLDRFFDRWIMGATLPRLRYSTMVADGEVVVRFEQLTEDIFDVPVTVTITFADSRTRDVIVPVTAQRVEQRIPVAGAVRQVQINRDSAALAQFEGT